MPTDVSPEPADGGENCACADQVSSSLFFQRVTVELGHPVQEPTSFSLTVPLSNPLKMTSPPSSCTVGLTNTTHERSCTRKKQSLS
ncbi:unnamed protein product [Tetraodon nigroviridis]|uniref:(spotted green pufferfish) hypothetical protein n=1 Tax=Tetraodon nigroviridis TaxID=99883 RepID=Q4SKZ0_TETNG|nr:unnamed protein product [Tetraodon nigroviridis]